MLSKKQQGFALIFVLVFVALIMGISAEIIYQSQVSSRTILHDQDEVQAEATALTGLEFAKFLIGLYSLADQYKTNPLFNNLFPKNIYSILNGQPIGASSFEDIEKQTGVSFNKLMSPEILEALKKVKGYFVIRVTSENAKINLNSFAYQDTKQTAKTAFLRFFSTPDAKKLLDIYGYTPEQMVNNLTSYIQITVTDTALDSITRSDYNNIGATYPPKHASLVSLEELRRIPGFHIDDIYNVFSNYFTIWPIKFEQKTLNINGAPTELVSALMVPNGQEPGMTQWDNFDLYRQKTIFDDRSIAKKLKEILPFMDQTSTDISDYFFGDQNSVFKVECRGVVNNVEKNVTVVYEKKQNNSNQPTQPPPKNPGGNQNTGKPKGSQQPVPTTTLPELPKISTLYSNWE